MIAKNFCIRSSEKQEHSHNPRRRQCWLLVEGLQQRFGINSGYEVLSCLGEVDVVFVVGACGCGHAGHANVDKSLGGSGVGDHLVHVTSCDVAGSVSGHDTGDDDRRLWAEVAQFGPRFCGVGDDGVLGDVGGCVIAAQGDENGSGFPLGQEHPMRGQDLIRCPSSCSGGAGISPATKTPFHFLGKAGSTSSLLGPGIPAELGVANDDGCILIHRGG